MDDALSCAFTGHRVIEERHRDGIEPLLARAIEYAYSQGVRRFYNGAAVGFDTLAARQVIRFRMTHPDVTLHMLIPCASQEERWNERQREMYSFILSHADTVEYLSPTYYRGCMQVRNKKLVDSADMLIAYVGSETGGSAYTLGLAKKRGIMIFNLYNHIG